MEPGPPPPDQGPPPEATDRDRRSLPVAVVLVAILVLATGSLIVRPLPSVADKPIAEDGYYALAVARHIALGHGITIDGRTPTSGFQPLFTFLTVPAFVLTGGDRHTSLRLVLVLHWLFFAGTASLLGLIARDALTSQPPARRSLYGWLTAFMYLAGVGPFLNAFNGLETGCLLFCYALAWRHYQVRGTARWLDLTALGALLGVTVLARIDAVFLVVAACLYLVLRGEGESRFVIRIARAAVVGIVAFIVSLPWWLYNLMVFGSLMPSSGAAQQYWTLSGQRALAALRYGLQLTIPAIYTPHLSRFDSLAADLVRGGLTVAVALLLWHHRRRVAGPAGGDRRERGLAFAGIVLATCLMLVAWYALSSHSTHFYRRYFAPISLLAPSALGYLLLAAIARAPRGALVLCAVAGLPLLGSMALLHGGGLWANRVEHNPMYTEQLPLVQECVPKEAVVAAGQSGTLGYFCDRVVNLDGKVNREALDHQNDMWHYLRERGIRWVCDWPPIADRYLGPRPVERGWHQVAQKGSFVLWHQEPIPAGAPQR